MPLAKKYVQEQIASADPADHKSSVRFVTTTALAAYTRVGNTITANANGAMAAQDGLTPVEGDGLLLTLGASPVDNGIYTVVEAGDGGTPFQLVRRTDADRAEFVTSGMRVPVAQGVRHGGRGKEFVLVTPDPIVLNVTALDFEEVDAGGVGTITSITGGDSAEVQFGRQMSHTEDLSIEDGDLSVEGDLLGHSAPRNFLMELVPARSVRTIPYGDVAHFSGVLQVHGLLQVQGSLLDVTPDTGQDILDKLGDVLPPDNLIFGGNSPAVPRAPAVARAILDVPSTAEVTAEIAAAVGGSGGGSRLDTFWNGSSNADGSFSGADVTHTTSFTAEFNRINKWDGASAGIVTTLPVGVAADHNKRIAFKEVSGSNANALQIDTPDLATEIRVPENAGFGVNSIVTRGPNSLLVLQYDFGINTWLVVETSSVRGFLNAGGATTAVGRQAMAVVTVGSATNSTAFGDSALANLTTGASNTAVGASALTSVQTGTSNTAVGSNALLACTGGQNTAIGAACLDSCTTGSANTAVGNNAAQALSTGSNNVAIGASAMQNGIVTGSDNVAVGSNALLALTTASNNVAVGSSALRTITTGTRNTAVGFDALRLAITGTSDNTAVGYQAARSMTSGQLNTAIGGSALFTNSTATTSTAVGFEALFTNNASSQTAVGYQAMRANSSGTNNTAVGYQSLDANTTGAGNTAMGHSALGGAIAQSNNTAIGSASLGASGSGSNNTAVGAEALSAATGGNSTGVGYQALTANTAAGNTAVGYQAAKANTSGSGNTAIGTSALAANTSPTGNTAVGFQAMLISNSGNNNTGVGASVLDALSSGGNNTAVGANAMGALTTSSDNVAIGHDAMAVATTADSTVAVGKGAGSLLDTGDSNTFVGYRAGDTCTTGSGNIVIGADADVPAAGTSNYLNIGNTLIGDVSTGDAGFARFLLRSTTAGITASTTQTQGQGPLTKDVNQVSVVANPNDTVTLPSAAAGMEIIVINSGANTLQVFPAAGDNLGAGVDTATTQLTGVTNRYVAYDATNWVKL